jgi:hypothetical protein
VVVFCNFPLCRSSFYRTKKADPLGEEDESLGEYYTDLEGGVSKDGDASDEKLPAARVFPAARSSSLLSPSSSCFPSASTT